MLRVVFTANIHPHYIILRRGVGVKGQLGRRHLLVRCRRCPRIRFSRSWPLPFPLPIGLPLPLPFVLLLLVAAALDSSISSSVAAAFSAYIFFVM